MGLFSFITDLFGAGDAQDSRNKDLAFEKDRFATEKALATRQTQIAETLARQGVATRRDAAGNTTYYDPATNAWQTILTPEQQQIQDASDREQRLQLGPDAQSARNQRIGAADNREQDNEQAGNARVSLTDILSGRGAASPDKLASALAMSRRGAISAGLQDYSNELGTQAIRGGASSLDHVGSALALARAKAVAEGMGNPTVEGEQLARERNSSDIAARAGLYNGFASRASNIADAPFSPAGIDAALRPTQAAAADNGLQGGSAAATAYANAARGLAIAPKPDFVGDSKSHYWDQLGGATNTFLGGLESQFGGGSGANATISKILGFL